MRSAWYIKFVDSLLAGLGIAGFLSIMMELLPMSLLMKYENLLTTIYFIIQLGLPILFAIGYTIYWQKLEGKPGMEETSLKRHSLMRLVIRYWLAFSIATYGFAKIFKTQFSESISRDDSLVRDLNGFNLTWNYFAYSYTFAVIIGMVQIIGSILLLFRRTTLLGCMILIPVMVNILLINLFYEIAVGALVNSIIFTLGLIYLLLQYWPDIRSILFKPLPGTLPPRKPLLTHGLGFVFVAAAAALILSFLNSVKETRLKGKWKVSKMMRNQKEVDRSNWEADSSAWNTFYIEQLGNVVISQNPYYKEKKRSLYCMLEENGKDLTFIFQNKNNDTMRAKILSETANRVSMTAYFKKDTLQLDMEKVKK